jgi:hypothetical protein
MTDDSVPTMARVECRSEGRGDEHPIAIVVGNRWFTIVDTLDRAMVASVEAGQPIRHRLWVELDDGRRCELRRTLPDGTWQVFFPTPDDRPPAGRAK